MTGSDKLVQIGEFDTGANFGILGHNIFGGGQSRGKFRVVFAQTSVATPRAPIAVTRFARHGDQLHQKASLRRG